MPRFPEAPKSLLIQSASRKGRAGTTVSRADLEGPHPSTFAPDAHDEPDARGTSADDAPTEPGPGQRWSTWRSVAKGQRGPEPVPDWLVTRDAAFDTELGILKTGKEADAFLVERALSPDAAPGPAGEPARCLLVAKRYRSLDHGQFHRGTEYTEGRRVRRTRDQRAMEDRKSAWGRAVSATQWADAEFVALRDAWSAGAPVPYPVQIDGTEVLMEFVGTEEVDDDGRTQVVAAPRLTRERPSDDLLESYWEQLTHGMSVLARLGFAHGDLSPYNILAHGERLVVIDLPQVVDLVANPFASEVLLRDCRTVCAWFTARGLDVDPDALFADLLAQAL
ncbi:serine protein kinase RIO [Promicromonospora thailandica]|uniref:non-specific serine/threonine protein kinase n=1 Tax=Promicromonospora thailandica TaxID=765201 RepID=A0A9X2G6U9_9MICO|nr:RIO1 family regulatory kinase/ATPase [Promicromonospora thailandica]MCP2266668.1 RIO kinase 1 [Promicromonospora thailandica]BFF17250.1 RIO kinase 1 [Promicromonospora thailandica]